MNTCKVSKQYLESFVYDVDVAPSKSTNKNNSNGLSSRLESYSMNLKVFCSHSSDFEIVYTSGFAARGKTKFRSN